MSNRIDQTPDGRVISQALDSLERLVDAHRLSMVLQMLCTICELKGEHLRHNWQDAVTAKNWEDAASRIGNLAERIAIRNGI